MKPQDYLNNTTVRRCSARLQAQQLQSIGTPLIELPLQPPLEPPSISHSLIEPLLTPAPRKYCPESVDNFVTEWVESIPRSEFYQRRNCESDILLHHTDSDPISRRCTKPEPNIEDTRDADGFATPLVLSSTNRRSNAHSFASLDITRSTGISGRSSGKALVEDPYYRQTNLAINNIYLRSFYDEYPEDITRLIDHVRKDSGSPGLLPDQLEQNTHLERLERGTAEPAVENFFKANVFPDPESSDSLYRIDKSPVAKHAVPDVGLKLKVSTPWPDMLYGYNRLGAFTHVQQIQLISMGSEMAANTQDLIFPFFVIEFKADGPGGPGSMWVATNQCLGGSASCVNIAERLNRQLRQCKNKEVQLIDSAVFSIAMNGTEARLYISWRHNELNYYMRRVKSFLLQEPEQYAAFCKYVWNIIDWGKNQRLKQIQDSLDNLLEESRRRTSSAAKSRPPPSDGPKSSSGYRLKASRKDFRS